MRVKEEDARVTQAASQPHRNAEARRPGGSDFDGDLLFAIYARVPCRCHTQCQYCTDCSCKHYLVVVRDSECHRRTTSSCVRHPRGFASEGSSFWST
ncbi:hypothetical protein FKP32DRAFT_230692 [Trametes sanguinea]|nr:hypothetical protein FKP32DRAFT_230692 [Trametes sanguinea]